MARENKVEQKPQTFNIVQVGRIKEERGLYEDITMLDTLLFLG
jgi:ABC-type uncharacterized transport system ATPase subunit